MVVLVVFLCSVPTRLQTQLTAHVGTVLAKTGHVAQFADKVASCQRYVGNIPNEVTL